MTESIQPDVLGKLLDQAKTAAQAETGIKMDIRSTAVDAIEDDYSKESFEAKVYYEGVWRPRGASRSIRIHVNRDEKLFFPSVTLGVHHSYSDEPQLPVVSIHAYALEEIVSEKLRALSGQRKYTIARDLYDLWSLNKTRVDMNRALEAYRREMQSKRDNSNVHKS